MPAMAAAPKPEVATLVVGCAALVVPFVFVTTEALLVTVTLVAAVALLPVMPCSASFMLPLKMSIHAEVVTALLRTGIALLTLSVNCSGSPVSMVNCTDASRRVTL